jgi:hypothetical protein
MLALKPYWGKPAVRNFREDDGDVGIIRSPVRAIVLPGTLRPTPASSPIAATRPTLRSPPARLRSSLATPPAACGFSTGPHRPRATEADASPRGSGEGRVDGSLIPSQINVSSGKVREPYARLDLVRPEATLL